MGRWGNVPLQQPRWLSGVVENFLFNGIILGWFALQNIFINEKFYCWNPEPKEGIPFVTKEEILVSLAANKTGTVCDFEYQMNKLVKVFQLATAIMPVSTFFLGLIQAVTGMFYMRLALHVIMLSAIGFLFIAEPVTMDYCIMIGSILMAIAGLNLAISNYSMSCLSGASSGMVMALLCGGFDESSAMGQIFIRSIKVLVTII